MADKKETEESSASINGETDLEGKTIIDSNGETVGKCKAVNIGDDGQIGLIFEIVINGVSVIPKQTIPYSAISKITDIIELKIPINIKLAQSVDDIREPKEIPDVEKKEKPEKEGEKVEKEEQKTIIEGKEEKIIIIDKPEIEKVIVEKSDVKDQIEKTKSKVNEEIPIEPKKLVSTESVIETPQANASEQLSKTLVDEKTTPTKLASVIDKPEEKTNLTEEILATASVAKLMVGLKESIGRLEKIFKLLDNSDENTKIEAIIALTNLTKISPELGLSVIPKMLNLSDEPQQDVRLAVAEQMGIIAETKPDLFKGYFIDLLENAYEEPIEEIREQIIKALHEIAIREPELASTGLSQFLKDVIIGKRVPEVPSKVLHDTTLKVVSGSFLLTRISIGVRLEFIAQGGKLGNRCAEELEDYNATLIGLTLIESFSPNKAEKIIENACFKKMGPIFVEVIKQMIEAYNEGSFSALEEVVDKKIEIPTAVVERFFEIKINKALQGVKNVPMEVFLENSIIDKEEAEQIIYRLVLQKRINASISMSNGKTFIATIDEDESTEKKETTKKATKTTTKTTTTKKKTPAKTTTTKKPSSTKKTTENTTSSKSKTNES
ncbi:MAG: HEAT repeat domain-containing protein [Asgard group archaeon]|nr:HEAT repeat domain-containing protein [Asgard group archaeon]